MEATILILKITWWFSVSVAECINVLSCCCVCRCWQWIWRKMASSHTWGKPPKSLGLPIAWRKPYVSEWGSEGTEDFYPNLDRKTSTQILISHDMEGSSDAKDRLLPWEWLLHSWLVADVCCGLSHRKVVIMAVTVLLFCLLLQQ